jgi:hypothetical protein
MRHSPSSLVIGAALLVAVPYVLIRAGESFSTSHARESNGQVDSGDKRALSDGRTFPGHAETPALSAPEAPADLAAEVSAAAAHECAGTAAADAPSARLTSEAFAELARASDATSFDQNAGMNADFRDHGVGLVPRILSINPEEKSAWLGAGAIGAVLRLPFGWFATDDGRRTLVFDDDGRIQISLKLRRYGGGSLEDLARRLVEPYLKRDPALPVAMFKFEGGIAGAGVRGAEVDGESLDQVFLVRPASRPGYVLVASISAQGEDSRIALNLAGDILAGLETPRDLVAQN